MKTNMNINKQAYSISEFCEIHSISRSMFYLLEKENKIPRCMKIGRRRVISVEAAKEWRQKMEEN